MNWLTKSDRSKKRRVKSILFGILLSVGLLTIIIAILSMIKIVDYSLFQIPQYGIQIKYPTFWRRIDQPGHPEAIVVFIAPPQSPVDENFANISITYFDLAKDPMTFSRFTQTSIKQLTVTFEGYVKVLESRPFTLNNRPAYRFMYIGQNEAVSDPNQYLHVWTIIGTRAYILTYFNRSSKFKLHLNKFNTMVKSFNIL